MSFTDEELRGIARFLELQRLTATEERVAAQAAAVALTKAALLADDEKLVTWLLGMAAAYRANLSK